MREQRKKYSLWFTWNDNNKNKSNQNEMYHSKGSTWLSFSWINFPHDLKWFVKMKYATGLIRPVMMLS